MIEITHPGVFPPNETVDPLAFNEGDPTDEPAGPQALGQTPPDDYAVFDLETRRAASEVGGWSNADRMGMSVGVVWYKDEFHVFYQKDAGALALLLKQASVVVGFNHVGFDYKVLQGLIGYNLTSHTHNLDILAYAHNRLGHRLSLDAIASATLGTGKSSDGMQALQWWRNGQIEKIVEYCKQDVGVTHSLFLTGLQKKRLYYRDRSGRHQSFPVHWTHAMR